MLKSRIAIIDGFRGVAILFVMLFHYFSRWIPPKNDIVLYPYGNTYDYFGYGWTGVQFFFMISGFVIHFTLEKTDKFSSFWIKRAIRLMPSMIVASFITLFIFRFFDKDYIFPSSHQFINLIPGIFFLSPALLNNIFHNFNIHFEYLSRSYWSLWPEIQFYVFVSLVYFHNKKNFLRNFLLASLFVILVSFGMQAGLSKDDHMIQLPESLIQIYRNWLWVIFGIAPFLPFFIFGVLCYELFRKRSIGEKTHLWIFIMFGLNILIMMISEKDIKAKILYLIMILFFFFFIYFPERMSFFKHKYLVAVGFSSYFLYLVHEQAGVLLIYTFGMYFDPAFILPVILIIALIFFSLFFSTKVDKIIMAYLRKKWLNDSD